MATQLCPKCNADSFTWSIDEEKSPYTKWGCGNCGYTAFEDEKLERECNKCNNKTESCLEDNIILYWWCCSCNAITIIKQKES